MPKGTKRKREDEDQPDPPPRQSGRQRKKKSFWVKFEEEWSPPRGTKNPTPQQPKATENKPGPSSALDPLPQEDPKAEDTVTWPSDEEHWKQLLPSNHRKRLYFIHKGLERISKRYYLSAWAKCCKKKYITIHIVR